VRHARPSTHPRRDVEIVRSAGTVVAFWDNDSLGTRHAIELAHKMAKTLVVVRA